MLLELCQCWVLDEAQFVRFRQLVEDEEEVDANCTDDVFGSTPLIWLCSNNHSDGLFDCVDLILHRSDIQINQTTKDGWNALMLLCSLSKSDQIVEVAQLLIANGIFINQTDEDGRNALMRLCQVSRNEKILEVAQFLLANGSDINQTSEYGRNALMLLCWRSNSDKIVEVAQLLIDNGIHFNQTDQWGRNAAELLKLNSRVSESKKQEIRALLRH